MPADHDLTEEEWEDHMREIMEIGEIEDTRSHEIDMSWAVVFSRLNKDLLYNGTLPVNKANLHVSSLGTYAQIPAASSGQNTAIETILPTNDADEIERWKLVPCSARLTFSKSWVQFRCKLLESQGYPEIFEIESKSNAVIDCQVYRMANDENGNRLLYINLKLRRNGVPAVVEMCLKKIVGDEVPGLTQGEGEYVDQEEGGRFYEEPYIEG